MASGIKNLRMALIYEIMKGLVAERDAGRDCGDRFFQLFCCAAALPLPEFYKFVSQV
jgi:hypothetical protein